MKNKIFVLLFLLLIPSVWNLLSPGFFESDDGEWMIIRFSAFFQALRDGQFPVRLLDRLNFSYGYPVANFLYPGFMYIAAPFRVLGFGFADSIKAELIISMIAGGVFAYFWLRKIFDNLSALVGAIFYTYAPYHLFDLYRRGSVGEILALTILPFVLWQIERNSLFWGTIGIGLLIISHNTLAFIFLAFIILYILLGIYFSSEKKVSAKNLATMVFLGVGLSSFFWLPAVFELQYTVFSKTTVSEFSKYFAGFDLIGLSSFAVLIITGLLFLLRIIDIKKQGMMLVMFAAAALSVFMATSPSSIIWQNFPVSFIQFPFRVLSVAILCLSFLASGIVYLTPKKYKAPVAAVIVAITFVSAYPYLTSYKNTAKDDSFYSTNEATTTVKDEYMPYWVKEKPSARFNNKVELIKGSGDLSDISYDSKKIVFHADLKSSSVVRVNTIFYPGWEAGVNGAEKEILYNNSYGVMDLKLGKGKNDVQFSFNETNLRLFADILSLGSLIVLIFMSTKKLKGIKND